MRAPLLALLLVAAGGDAHAQVSEDDAPVPVTEDDAKNLELDFAIPSGPAFAFLGTSPTQILQPGSLKDLGIDFANGFDKDGKLKAGLAIAAQPASWHPRLARLRGLELSLGTARVSDEGAGLMSGSGITDAAVGARWTLIDRGHPWKSKIFRERVFTQLRDDCKQHEPPLPDAPDHEARARCYRECMKDRLLANHEQFEDEYWNAFRVEIGAATGWRLPGSNPFASESFYLGYSGWGLVSGSIPGPSAWLQKHSLWTAVVQFDQRREREGSPYTEQVKGGVRGFLGTNRIHAYAEVIFKYRWAPAQMSRVDDRDWDWTLGGELRIRDSQWFVIGLGNALDDDSSVQVLGSLKWAVVDQARFPRPE